MSQFDDRLQQFKDAAHALVEAWEPEQMVDGYPEYLPSFDEFAADFADVESQPVLESEAEEIRYQAEPCQRCGTEDVGRYSHPPQTVCDDCEAEIAGPGPDPSEQEEAEHYGWSPEELEAMETHYEQEDKRGELAGLPHSLPCVECTSRLGDSRYGDMFDESTYVQSQVVGLGSVVEQRRDPTQTYRLACGHVTI